MTRERPTDQTSILCDDVYDDERRRGKVVGSSHDGVRRDGIDSERVISIDNGAARIEPLIEPGWGNVSLTYGPFDRARGLALCVFMLNGHNTAQSGRLPDGFRGRLWRWWVGYEPYARTARAIGFLKSARFARFARQVRCWFRRRTGTPDTSVPSEQLAVGRSAGRRVDAADAPLGFLKTSRIAHLARQIRSWLLKHARAPDMPVLDENLAVGWTTKPTINKIDPVQGQTFVMHATGPENGELWARVGPRYAKLVRGVQNVPIYYVIVLRDAGCVYYTSSMPDAIGLGDYPAMRPVAIDYQERALELYAGIHQGVLGQIGFRLDSRIYQTRVAHIAEHAVEFSGAHAADELDFAADLNGRTAIIGETWQTTDIDLAWLAPEKSSGLICGLLRAGSGLAWRLQDTRNYWAAIITENGIELNVVENGLASLVHSETSSLATGLCDLQILDDGSQIRLHLNGELCFPPIPDDRLAEATGVGVLTSTGVQSVEAHPRTVSLPAEFRLGTRWLTPADRVIVADEFRGTGELAGKHTIIGDKTWARTLGTGAIDLNGLGSACIRGSIAEPNPGRTAHTIEWDNPDFADVSVTLIPPGTGRGENELAIAGLIFWQDEENYFTANTWLKDSYPGASISCFFQVDGFEDIYDAIWTNVSERVFWGVPVRLRIIFDGIRYQVYLNDEPVLYRELTDVYPNCPRWQIRRVGLLANWEFGDDTGTAFENFECRV